MGNQSRYTEPALPLLAALAGAALAQIALRLARPRAAD